MYYVTHDTPRGVGTRKIIAVAGAGACRRRGLTLTIRSRCTGDASATEPLLADAPVKTIRSRPRKWDDREWVGTGEALAVLLAYGRDDQRARNSSRKAGGVSWGSGRKQGATMIGPGVMTIGPDPRPGSVLRQATAMGRFDPIEHWPSGHRADRVDNLAHIAQSKGSRRKGRAQEREEQWSWEGGSWRFVS